MIDVKNRALQLIGIQLAEQMVNSALMQAAIEAMQKDAEDRVRQAEDKDD